MSLRRDLPAIDVDALRAQAPVGLKVLSMARVRFTKASVTRAVQAVQAAGVAVGKVEVDQSGRIIVYATGETPAPYEADGSVNDWDEALDGSP